jgi:hypothetical protein
LKGINSDFENYCERIDSIQYYTFSPSSGKGTLSASNEFKWLLEPLAKCSKGAAVTDQLGWVAPALPLNVHFAVF